MFRHDLPLAIGFAVLMHLLLVGLVMFTWHADADLTSVPEIPPHVRAVVMEKPEPKPAPRKPAPRPDPKPAPKPEPKPEPEPAPEAQEPADTAVKKEPPEPAFSEPELEEMLAREELEMAEAARQSEDEEDSGEAREGEKVEDNPELAGYISAIRSAVARRWSRPPGARNEMETVVRIRLLPGGEVVDVTVVESSGHSGLDRSTVAAVKNASPLPVPEGDDFNEFRVFRISFKPEDLRL